MMERALSFARPSAPEDCLPDQTAELATPGDHLWMIWLRLDGLPLADLNDIPGREDDYDYELRIWISCLRCLLGALSSWSGGSVSELVARRSGWRGELWRLQGRADLSTERLLSMSSFGWPPTLWCAAPVPRETSPQALKSLLQNEDRGWWSSHGFKEPFAALWTNSSPFDLLESRVAQLPAEIVVDDVPFESHRFRVR